jgi:mannose-1-phosphate guanylyltransferase
MRRSSSKKHRWGVILAGGDGTRLKDLTQTVSDDNRPKQFCPLLGGRTLLAQTRSRIASSIDFSRTLFVLTSKHKCFYTSELESVPAIQTIVQPSNRGTLPAILWSLLRIAHLDRNASVAFFPSDHYYSNEQEFMDGVEAAFECAEVDHSSVILLGAKPEHPEVEYGWIEPDARAVGPFGCGPIGIKRFWEKPSYDIAKDLLDRGCLWNTFVMIGRVTAFTEMIQQAVPGIYRHFEAILRLLGPNTEAEIVQTVYNALPIADFSRQVLSVSTGKLAVAPLGDVGWNDLGDPRRLVTTLFESGIENPWVISGCCSYCGRTLAAS